jgi:peptide/nickel transport system permease protein
MTVVAGPEPKPNSGPSASVGGRRRARPGKDVAFRVGVLLITVWALVAVTFPLWGPFDPVTDQDLLSRLAPPSAEHWFGTDELGRDVFSRVMAGAQLSLPTAVVTVLVSALVGSVVGAFAGFVGGVVDEAIMRFCDIVLSFPAIVLALALATALGPSARNVVISIAVVMWPEYARLMRGQVLSIRNNLHVTAAKSVGAGPVRVFTRHVLPFGLPPVVVKATVDLGMVILLAAGLSFIGVGAPPPAPEWGAMVSEAQNFMDQWWLAVFPGLAILSLVIAFNFVGDAMRDKLDPHTRAQVGFRGRRALRGKRTTREVEAPL